MNCHVVQSVVDSFIIHNMEHDTTCGSNIGFTDADGFLKFIRTVCIRTCCMDHISTLTSDYTFDVAAINTDHPWHHQHGKEAVNGECCRVAIFFLREYIQQQLNIQSLRIIGSSLGGYYAQYFGSVHKNAKIVLINPALEPQKTLKTQIGFNVNMVTGEPFVFSQQDYETLVNYDVDAEQLRNRCLLLVDEADEVIDCRHAIRKYENLATIKVFPGGSHSFEHLQEAEKLIINFLGL